jgi:hypothetical protein
MGRPFGVLVVVDVPGIDADEPRAAVVQGAKRGPRQEGVGTEIGILSPQAIPAEAAEHRLARDIERTAHGLSKVRDLGRGTRGQMTEIDHDARQHEFVDAERADIAAIAVAHIGRIDIGTDGGLKTDFR